HRPRRSWLRWSRRAVVRSARRIRLPGTRSHVRQTLRVHTAARGPAEDIRLLIEQFDLGVVKELPGLVGGLLVRIHDAGAGLRSTDAHDLADSARSAA